MLALLVVTVGGASCLIRFMAREPMEGTDHDRGGHGPAGTCLPPACRQPVRHGRPGGALGQCGGLGQWLQPGPSSAPAPACHEQHGPGTRDKCLPAGEGRVAQSPKVNRPPPASMTILPTDSGWPRTALTSLSATYSWRSSPLSPLGCSRAASECTSSRRSSRPPPEKGSKSHGKLLSLTIPGLPASRT
jgi:hypothetical protein